MNLQTTRSLCFQSGSRAQFAYEHAVQIIAQFARKGAAEMVQLNGHVLTVPAWFPISIS